MVRGVDPDTADQEDVVADDDPRAVEQHRVEVRVEALPDADVEAELAAEGGLEVGARADVLEQLAQQRLALLLRAPELSLYAVERSTARSRRRSAAASVVVHRAREDVGALGFEGHAAGVSQSPACGAARAGRRAPPGSLRAAGSLVVTSAAVLPPTPTRPRSRGAPRSRGTGPRSSRAGVAVRPGRAGRLGRRRRAEGGRGEEGGDDQRRRCLNLRMDVLLGDGEDGTGKDRTDAPSRAP